MFRIIWPVTRDLTAAQVEQEYRDAVQNGEVEPGLDDPRDMARELDSAGLYSFAKGAF